MRPVDLISLVKSRFVGGVQRALHVIGQPGIGKTEIPGQAVKELSVELKEEIGFKVLHTPLMQVEDYGLPIPSQDRTSVNFAVSKDKFPLIDSNCPERGILLLDEINQAKEDQQKVVANLMQAREIHGHKLKPGWMIMSTGNRSTDRAGAGRLLTHLMDRLTQVELDVSFEDWRLWAINNNVAMDVIVFLSFKRALLNTFDSKLDKNATPRSWVQGVAAQLGKVPAHLELETFKGDVGEGPASEFLAWVQIKRTLPNPETILRDPSNAPIPNIKEPNGAGTLYAIISTFLNMLTVKNFDLMMIYVNRIPDEYQMLFIRAAEKQKPEIIATKAYQLWQTKNGVNLLV
jgi:hypothetical protein